MPSLVLPTGFHQLFLKTFLPLIVGLITSWRGLGTDLTLHEWAMRVMPSPSNSIGRSLVGTCPKKVACMAYIAYDWDGCAWYHWTTPAISSAAITI